MKLKFTSYIDVTDKEYSEILAKKLDILEKTGQDLDVINMIIALGLAQCLNENTYDYSLK